MLLILPLSGGSLIVGLHVAETLRHMEDVDSDVFATQPLYDLYTRSFGHLSDKTARLKTIVEHINLAAMGKLVDFKPDLVLVMALAPIIPWFIERSGQLGVLTAHWYIENYRYYPADPLIPRWQIIAPYYDHFFTIQKGAFHQTIQAAGAKNVHYLPTGCNPYLQHDQSESSPLCSQYASDICFIGHPYPNRVDLFKSLRDYNITLWGPGWSDIPGLKQLARGNGTWVDIHEEAKILGSSEIGLNIHSSLETDTLIQRGDFLNPRVFTLAASGTFQLVDEQEPLGEFFEIGKEVATYTDLRSLKSQLSYFLEHPIERQDMAKRARERAFEEHTYDHRVREILRVAGLCR